MELDFIKQPAPLNEGRWIDDIPDNPGLRLCVRSSRFKPFREAVGGQARRFGKELQKDSGLLDFTVRSGKPMAEHLLTDWDLSAATGPSHITSGGKPLKYSPENAIAVLTLDDDHGIGEGFRRAVEWAANKVAEDLAKSTEEAAGN